MQQVAPKNYQVHLIPDLDNFTFAGNVTLIVEAKTAIEELCLNILELTIFDCAVELNADFVDCDFETDSDKEELKIRLPQKIEGDFSIKIRYEGEINDKIAGFYRSQYVSSEKPKHIAVTQFEESDARRAFPCMDHPAKKATFDIIMDVDKDYIQQCHICRDAIR